MKIGEVDAEERLGFGRSFHPEGKMSGVQRSSDVTTADSRWCNVADRSGPLPIADLIRSQRQQSA